VTLTAQGKELASRVSKAFTILQAATEKISPNKDGAIILTCTISMASHWLSNRMADILETQPGPLQLTVDATPALRSIEEMEADVAIRYLPVNSDHTTMSRCLIEESFLPLCTQRYLGQYGPINQPEDMLNAILIHSPWYTVAGRGDACWSEWFETFKLSERCPTPLLTFTRVGCAMQEVLMNGGIMIGSTAVGVDAIREKPLVKIFGDRYVLKSPYEYRILWGESANTSPEIRALIDKLLLAAGKNPEFGDQGYS
jgi:LysR family glycine cleavage system transcriptional activator